MTTQQSQNSEMMPKKVWVMVHKWMLGGLEVMAIKHNAGHEYIRADIVKNREDSLIKAFQDLTADDYYVASEKVYRGAGLEELKNG